MSLLKQITNPPFKAWIYCKYIPMFFEKGLKETEKHFKDNIWTCDSYDETNTLKHTMTVKPKITFDMYGTGCKDSFEISIEEFKIPLNKFKNYVIDYSLIMCEDVLGNKRTMTKLVFDGQYLKHNDNLVVVFRRL